MIPILNKHYHVIVIIKIIIIIVLHCDLCSELVLSADIYGGGGKLVTQGEYPPA